MSPDEEGRYRRVLDALYLANSGSAPEESVRVWAGYTQRRWITHREALARAFVVSEDGMWLQKRVAIEVATAQRRVAKAVESGRAGADKRWRRDRKPKESPKRPDSEPLAGTQGTQGTQAPDGLTPSSLRSSSSDLSHSTATATTKTEDRKRFEAEATRRCEGQALDPMKAFEVGQAIVRDQSRSEEPA